MKAFEHALFKSFLDAAEHAGMTTPITGETHAA